MATTGGGGQRGEERTAGGASSATIMHRRSVAAGSTHAHGVMPASWWRPTSTHRSGSAGWQPRRGGGGGHRSVAARPEAPAVWGLAGTPGRGRHSTVRPPRPPTRSPHRAPLPMAGVPGTPQGLPEINDEPLRPRGAPPRGAAAGPPPRCRPATPLPVRDSHLVPDATRRWAPVQPARAKGHARPRRGGSPPRAKGARPGHDWRPGSRARLPTGAAGQSGQPRRAACGRGRHASWRGRAS